eukprot:6908356-Alexandrium_andersonii.AAC.1
MRKRPASAFAGIGEAAAGSGDTPAQPLEDRGGLKGCLLLCACGSVARPESCGVFSSYYGFGA